MNEMKNLTSLTEAESCAQKLVRTIEENPDFARKEECLTALKELLNLYPGSPMAKAYARGLFAYFSATDSCMLSCTYMPCLHELEGLMKAWPEAEIADLYAAALLEVLEWHDLYSELRYREGTMKEGANLLSAVEYFKKHQSDHQDAVSWNRPDSFVAALQKLLEQYPTEVMAKNYGDGLIFILKKEQDPAKKHEYHEQLKQLCLKYPGLKAALDPHHS